MIELIINGALPKPGKCISCGYSGNDRWYFSFSARVPRMGQILLCTTKYPDPDGKGTGCMNEAARRFELGFMERREVDKILVNDQRLKAENDRLGTATNKFTDRFAALVSSFLSDISPSHEISTVGTPADQGGIETPRGNSVQTNTASGQAINLTSK